MAEATNLHKRLAMGENESIAKAPGKGSPAKFARGGAVRDKDANRINDSSQKQPILKSSGLKIATMKKGGVSRGR